MEIEKRGKLYGIPVYVTLSTFEAPLVRGRNFAWDILLQIALMIAVYICFVEGFPIEIEDEQ